MPRYYSEKGPPSSRRFPSISQPGKFVGYREHQNEIGRPLPEPIKVPNDRLERFRNARIERRTYTKAQLRRAWIDAHATLYAKQHGIPKPTQKDLRRVKRSKEFKEAVANLLSNDPDLEDIGQYEIYGEEDYELYQ